MSHADESEELTREVEIGIVSAFGWAIIEFEAVLFQKYLVMSAPASLITEDMFKQYLRDMEAKGYVSPLEFHGRRAWRRLVIESELEEPAMTPEEVREFIAKAQEAEKKRSKKKTRISEHRVSESRHVADSIIQTLEQVLPKRKGGQKPWESSLMDHVEGMHRALTDSQDEFLGYVKKNIPPAYDPMKKLLRANGEEMLLLGLRVIESGQRAYPPQ
ncbi:MAG: hypothetical protein ACFFCP_02910 [Promethearchaeota archaeon]